MIDLIMHTDDVERLSAIFRDLDTKRPIVDEHRVEYAVVDIKEGVRLDEIVAQQTTIPITYHEISKMVSEETWELSLLDMLKEID